MIGRDRQRQDVLLSAVVHADLGFERVTSRAYHWCSRSMVGATTSAERLLRWMAWMATKVLPAPVGSTMLPRRRPVPRRRPLPAVVVRLAAVIQGAVQMLPARDDVARIEMLDSRVVVRLTAPFAFDPLKGRTGGIGLWSVGDDQCAALEGEGRSVRHENLFRLVFTAEYFTPTAMNSNRKSAQDDHP